MSAAINISPYSSLLERKLFLSTSTVELPPLPDSVAAIIEPVSSQLDREMLTVKYLILVGLQSQTRKSSDYKAIYSHASGLVKTILLNTQLPIDDFELIYNLWELRLSLLVLIDDSYCFNMAKQESKNLSNHLFKLTQVLHGDIRRIGFPENLPVSLELLMIRLRTNSRSTVCTSDLYSLLWIVRLRMSQSLEDSAFLHKSKAIIWIISFNISVNLIAKRDYLTFLTHAETIIASVTSESNLVVSHYYLLCALVMLIQGDYSKSESYIVKLKEVNQVDSLQDLDSINDLQTVLTMISPILDNEDLIGPMASKPKIASWEDLLNLNKNTRITGRILCCYCSLVELNIRSSDNHLDLLRNDKTADPELLFETEEELVNCLKNKDVDIIDPMIKCWKFNVNKLYGFE